MIVPALLTVGTLGLMYATRDPVRELKQGKRYRIGVNFNTKLFPLGGAADLPTALRREVPNAINEALVSFGFTNVAYVSGPSDAKDGVYTYWYDGTWARPETTIQGTLYPWINFGFYEKLL